MRWGAKFQNGFTIVELVVVITVVGVLSAVAGPKFIGNDVFEVSGAQSTVLSALRYAQKTAIAQRTTVYVSMNTATRTLCLGYTNNCSSPTTDPVTRTAYRKTLSSAVMVTASNNRLGFDGLGRPVPNADATYTISNVVDTSQASKVITIEAETGYVH